MFHADDYYFMASYARNKRRAITTAGSALFSVFVTTVNVKRREASYESPDAQFRSRLKTTGAGFSVIYNFDKSDGANPNSTPLLHTNGVIYGLTAAGGLYDDGIMYTVDAGLKPFASVFVYPSDKVGSSVGILGQGFLGATGVLFGSGAGTFTASADTYMTAKVVAGATTGPVTVKEPGGNLVSPVSFKIVPTITNFSPPGGPVGTSVVIKGMSLSEATEVKFGGIAATAFTVNSNTQVTATVPIGAVTGKITITTPGGTATSSTTFTVQ